MGVCEVEAEGEGEDFVQAAEQADVVLVLLEEEEEVAGTDDVLISSKNDR